MKIVRRMERGREGIWAEVDFDLCPDEVAVAVRVEKIDPHRRLVDRLFCEGLRERYGPSPGSVFLVEVYLSSPSEAEGENDVVLEAKTEDDLVQAVPIITAQRPVVFGKIRSSIHKVRVLERGEDYFLLLVWADPTLAVLGPLDEAPNKQILLDP